MYGDFVEDDRLGLGKDGVYDLGHMLGIHRPAWVTGSFFCPTKVGIDDAGKHHGDTDTVLFHLPQNRARKTNYTMLRGYIRSHVGDGPPPDIGSDVDDLPCLALQHMRQDSVSHVDEAIEINPQNGLNFLGCPLDQGLVPTQPCIVNQDVDSALLRQNSLNGLVDRLGVSYIKRMDGGATAFSSDFIGNSLQVGGSAGTQSDMHPCAGKAVDKVATKATAGSGKYSRLVVEHK